MLNFYRRSRVSLPLEFLVGVIHISKTANEFMPGSGRGKSWSQMTRKEIIGTLSAFTVIGCLIGAGGVLKLLHEDLGWFAIVPLSALVAVTYAVLNQYRWALRELKSRGR